MKRIFNNQQVRVFSLGIHYHPRVDHCICKGFNYELFFWTKDGWKSKGEQIATDTILYCQVPSKALFYLHNHTLNKDGHMFFMKNNIQNF